MAIERPQVNPARRPAGRAAHPQEPIPRGYGGADRWREQQGHLPSLALVPGADQALGVLKHLRISGATGGGLYVGQGLPFVLHLALIEAHCGMVVERERKSTAATAMHPTGNIPLRRSE